MGTARHMVREVSVARPLLLTSNIRMMVFVLATSGASEAQRASWKEKLCMSKEQVDTTCATSLGLG